MKKQQKSDYIFNVITIGESGVGKTCIVNTYVDQKQASSSLSTIGVEFTNKEILIDGLAIKLKICDTAGQERFRNLTVQYFRDAKGILIVYDITNLTTFEFLNFWIEQLQNHTSLDKISLVIVANKVDQENERKVTYAQGKEFADKYGAKFFETSASENRNINETFQALIRDMVAKAKKAVTDLGNEKNKDTIKVDNVAIGKEEKKKKSSCC